MEIKKQKQEAAVATEQKQTHKGCRWWNRQSQIRRRKRAWEYMQGTQT